MTTRLQVARLAAAALVGAACSSGLPSSRPVVPSATLGSDLTTHPAPSATLFGDPSPSDGRWTVSVPARDGAHVLELTVLDELGLLTAVQPSLALPGSDSLTAGPISVGTLGPRTLVFHWGTSVCARRANILLAGGKRPLSVSMLPPRSGSGDCDAGAVTFAAAAETTRAVGLGEIIVVSQTSAEQSWASLVRDSDGTDRRVVVVDRAFVLEDYEPLLPLGEPLGLANPSIRREGPRTVLFSWRSRACAEVSEVQLSDHPDGHLVTIEPINLDGRPCDSPPAEQAIRLTFREETPVTSLVSALLRAP